MSRLAELGADLRRASDVLDAAEASCRQLAVNIGPTSDEATAVVALAEVWALLVFSKIN